VNLRLFGPISGAACAAIVRRNRFNKLDVHMPAPGTSRHLVRCSDMSEAGGGPEVSRATPARKFPLGQVGRFADLIPLPGRSDAALMHGA
jgi:hypothetical protein